MLTRDQQLVFCRQCLHRKMDIRKGLLCGITSEQATFEQDCSDFDKDENAEIVPIVAHEDLKGTELRNSIPPEAYTRLLSEQRFPQAIFAGGVAGLVAASLWALLTVLTSYQIGFAAIGVGYIVGFTFKFVGRGIEPIFGVVSAAVSLISVALGNFLSIIALTCEYEELPFFSTLLTFDYSYAPEVMMETFGIMDILFYGFALTVGYKAAFRDLVIEELTS